MCCSLSWPPYIFVILAFFIYILLTCRCCCCCCFLQFVKFANINEDTPSYHRRYDFFISKFSSMCHGNSDNIELRDNIRLAGIKGVQGVIRKTVSDDLVENIWEKQHMEKIVPSLLFNMQVRIGMNVSCCFFLNCYHTFIVIHII